ncbi:MAG: extracellular solute-binding protein [Nitriliruptorales bacterium]|nr:extracellular solute-binding protein [Nitriliruptorales bacterium]
MGLLLAWALILVGCSSGNGQPDSMVLNVIMADDWASTEPVTTAIRSFEQDHPGVQVRMEGLPFAQIADAVESRRASGAAVDVAQWHAFAAAALGIAEPLDDLWDEHLDRADFVPGAVEDVEWAGRLYGVPLDTNALVLLTNADALEGAGFTPSELDSVDVLADAVRAAASRNEFGLAFSNSSWSTYGLIRAHGGEVVEIADDGSPTFLLDSPEVIETFTLMESLVSDGSAAGASTQDVSTDSFALFQSGSSAMHLSGTWDVAAILQSDVPWELEVISLPTVEGRDAGTVIGGSSLFIPTGAEHRELAFEFMRRLIRPDIGLALAEQEGRIPTRTDVLEDPFFDSPVYATVREALPTASAMKLIAFPEASQAFSNAIQDVLTGAAGAREALEEAQRIAIEAEG